MTSADFRPWSRRDNPGAREIGFAIPERYNASRILFDNLARGRGDRLALTGPGGTRTYAELCAEASQWGHGFQSLGLKRGDRILMFLDDTPAYPAAFFGAVRAGFVPLLINTLTPPDLLQFYLSDAGAAVAVADAEFTSRFNAEACKDTPLQTLIVVNGAAGEHAVPKAARRASNGCRASPTDLPEADTDRDEMAFWMYSSGSTGRPKGIVHLQHDMAYSEQAFARNVLKLTPDDICFSVPKIFFAYGFGNAITFPFSVGAATLLLPGQPKPATIFEAIEQIPADRVLRLADALYLADQGRGRCGHRFLLAADGAVGRRGAFGRSLQRLEGADGPRDHRGPRLDRGAAHLSLQPPREEKTRRRRPARARLRNPAARTRTAARSATTRKASCGCAAIPTRRCTGTGRTSRPRPSARSGWIYTGDRFVRDADGFHFFRGRADDLIKISGQWVYPLEVELCLAEHPDIRECAVFAAELPDRRMTLKAVVVMNKRRVRCRAMPRRRCRITSRRSCCPTNIRARSGSSTELPKTGTGKIDRQALMRM